MERGVIEVDPRHTARRIRTAMQGSVIRALVELITNADDSYIRLENENNSDICVIEIEYKKDGHCGIFTIRDFAEGMSIEEVRESFKKYGAATSGMKKGKKVRGYFGQGAKDALAGMEEGKICTFKNDNFIECKLFIENGKPFYEICDPIFATQKLRNIHKILNNGTVAYFKADPAKFGSVPRFDTVQEELAKNYLLRKIMTNNKRCIRLTNKNLDETRLLVYRMPKGEEILSDDFNIKFSPFGDFPIKISIWRSYNELSQTGDNRDGGLLIVDEENIVLDISLFKYDNEPLASRFFGEVIIWRFRELLEKEEPVLSEERNGIAVRHPFCQSFIKEIEKRIENKINDEKIRKQKEDKSKIDLEEANRYKKAFSILNEIAEDEAQAVINLGKDGKDGIQEPPNGFCLYPSSAQITVGKRYRFELRLNTNIIPYGSKIEVSCTNLKIHVITSEIRLESKDGNGIIQKYITVEGKEPNIEGKLCATTNNLYSEVKIYVVPEKELLLSEGMAFQPENVTLRPNKPRGVYLLVWVKMIESGSTIRISSDNESIHISKDEILVREIDFIRHFAKYELEVWGEGDGQNAIITAEYESYIALLGICIRSKEEQEEKGKKGMFSDPEFNYDTDPLQRASYSSETGKVIVYVKFPVVKHYLGENCKYRKTLPAQVFVADLVAERCFYEIAKKKVDSSSALIRPEMRPDNIQREAYILSGKYGKKVHEILVEQNLLNESRESF